MTVLHEYPLIPWETAWIPVTWQPALQPLDLDRSLLPFNIRRQVSANRQNHNRTFLVKIVRYCDTWHKNLKRCCLIGYSRQLLLNTSRIKCKLSERFSTSKWRWQKTRYSNWPDRDTGISIWQFPHVIWLPWQTEPISSQAQLELEEVWQITCDLIQSIRRLRLIIRLQIRIKGKVK